MSHEAVDRYIDSIFTRYQTELCEQLASLQDPAVEDPARACRNLACMIETLTAFAVGHAVGRVVEAMRRIDATLAEPMAKAIATVKPPPVTSVLPPKKFFPDDKRPILDTLAGQLHQRLALAARHAREIMRVLAAVLTRLGHASALGRALLLLTGDPAAGFGFAEQLALGWSFFVAVVTDAADPDLPDEPRWQRGRALWSAWSRRIRGGAATKAPVREFILRVA